MSFADELQEKLGNHKTEEVINIINNIIIQIQELILDGLFTFEKLTEDHKKTLEKYSALIHLTMNSTGLTSLENFPCLKALQIVSYYLLI